MREDKEQERAAGPQSRAAEGKSRLHWSHVVLVISLALNLAVLGLVVGAILRGPPGPDGRSLATRDLGFGPYMMAFDKEDRARVGKGFAKRVGKPSQMRASVEGHFEAVEAALRAEPFDEVAFQQALDVQMDQLRGWQQAGLDALAVRVGEMDARTRAQFADRLSEALEAPPRDFGPGAGREGRDEGPFKGDK